MFNFVVLYSLIAAMSPRRPSSLDKGKKITKLRRQPPWYIIMVPGQIPHSAPIQAPSLVGGTHTTHCCGYHTIYIHFVTIPFCDSYTTPYCGTCNIPYRYY